MKTNIKILTELLIEKDKEIVCLKQQVDFLTQQFKLMQAQKFGSSSEKTVVANADQLTLFNEAETEANSEVSEPEIESITYSRKKRKGSVKMIFQVCQLSRLFMSCPKANVSVLTAAEKCMPAVMMFIGGS